MLDGRLVVQVIVAPPVVMLVGGGMEVRERVEIIIGSEQEASVPRGVPVPRQDQRKLLEVSVTSEKVPAAQTLSVRVEVREQRPFMVAGGGIEQEDPVQYS